MSSLSKTKLTRQAHYNSSDDCNALRMAENFTEVPITKPEALDDIYHCFDRWMKGLSIRSNSPDPIGYEYEEGECIRECDKVTYWGNEYLFRDACSDKGRNVFRLVYEGNRVFADGIEEFREYTHVVFKETSFGVMWKILPLSVNTFNTGQYDGCFTKNYDGIMDRMDIVNQVDLFGTYLDIAIENRAYILWTSLCA